MKRLLRLTWLRIRSVIRISKTIEKPLRDKAIAVAETVPLIEGVDSMKLSCPVCSRMICAPFNSDVRMILAVHLSLWHPDDVKIKWNDMQKCKQCSHHMPFLALGIGIGAGFATILFTFLAKNHARRLTR